MTTETESLEALHLWLATELPELRDGLEYLEKVHEDIGGIFFTEAQVERGWVPNVTTDALLEALRAHGVQRVVIFLTDPALGPGNPERTRVLLMQRGSSEPFAGAETAHEALCRAARKALEAAS